MAPVQNLMFGLNDRIRVLIHGVEFKGIAEWSDEDGFAANLTGLVANFSGDRKLPSTLLITINEAERGILLTPFFETTGGMTFRTGSPITAHVRLRAEAVIRKLPWKIRRTTKLTKLTLTSNALDLWYGEETAKIETDYLVKEITAHFKAEEKTYKDQSGELKIGLSITEPGSPAMGDYGFRTQAYASFIPRRPRELGDAIELAWSLEGVFEILSGFPRRQFSFQIRLDGWPDNDVPLGLAAGPQRKTSKDHPFAVFLGRSQTPDVMKIWSAYRKLRPSLAVMQSTVRYLSGSRLVLPEGFLTACNVIESIGKDAPNSNSMLPELLGKIAKSLKASDAALARLFEEKVRPKVPTNSSFKDRFELIKSRLQSLGLTVKLKHSNLSRVRAAYRHDVVALKNEDFEPMRAGIGLAWFLGLIWLCQKIGVPENVLGKAAASPLFHDQRGTGRRLWGEQPKLVQR